MRRGKITERSLYPAIKEIFREFGATSVQEVIVDTSPDLIVQWLGENWIVSVKIGEPRGKLLKDAFIQYITHMKDTKIPYGMIIFYPENIRKTKPSEEIIEKVVRSTRAYILVLNPQTEFFKPLSEALAEVSKILRQKLTVTFSLETVINLLRAHIEELMERVGVGEAHVLKILHDPELFFGINPIKKEEKKKHDVLRNVSKFLASYIFLSQTLFLRLYSEHRPTIIKDVNISTIRRDGARKLFTDIRNVNYGPIFDVDVLDVIPVDLIRSTFKLMFGLQIKDIRYELPGRLFHELMPKEMRKLLAAFYTRPIAAYILAQLTIEDSDATVFDPACGSGTILTMAYRRKLEIWQQRNKKGNPHKIFCEQQIYGCDIMPFAVHLTNANLAAMDPLTTIDLTLITFGDSLKLSSGQVVKPAFVTLMDYFEPKVNVFTRTGETLEIRLKPVDTVVMNPPFTKVERGIKKYIDLQRFEPRVGGEVGLWGHFVALADNFLKDGGTFGAVLPINLLRGRESESVRKIIFQEWLPLYVIKAARNYGFSEWAEYRDILLIAKKIEAKTS